MTAVLVIERDPSGSAALAGELAQRGLTVRTCETATDAIAAADSRAVDVVVCAMDLADPASAELCRELVSSLRAGGHDALQIGEPAGFGELVGDSPRMRELYGVLAKLADSDATVLITGESGTGKELVARAIHGHGPTASEPFVAINCAAMPPALLESELFGHAKGAFTDARTAKLGLFHAAGNGTVFLDEIGELPLELQPKLLRALQERALRPIGATTEVRFAARVITATNRDLEAMVEDGRFREDLFFRINVLTVTLPPLRSRGGDVVQLARHILRRIATRLRKPSRELSAEVAHRLMAYPWPGNVRELENTMEYAVALASTHEITISDLPEKIRGYQLPSQPLAIVGHDAEALVSLAELERRYVLRVLESVDGNKAAAARILGIERRTLYRMLERWDYADQAAQR